MWAQLELFAADERALYSMQMVSQSTHALVAVPSCDLRWTAQGSLTQQAALRNSSRVMAVAAGTRTSAIRLLWPVMQATCEPAVRSSMQRNVGGYVGIRFKSKVSRQLIGERWLMASYLRTLFYDLER